MKVLTKEKIGYIEFFINLVQKLRIFFFSAFWQVISYLKHLGWYKICVILILIFSIFFSFYNFGQRWGLGADDARDAMIALEALRRHELPLMGPFSSAGPFVFGGIYYWLIMFSYFVLPFYVNSPWILMGILNVLSVFLMIKIGEVLENKRLGIILGLLTLASPQLVGKALTLGNPNFVFIFSLLSIISFLLFSKRNNYLFAMSMGLFLGLAMSMHYQAINLLIFIPSIFFIFSITFKKRLIAFFLAFLAFLIPMIPLLYWDYNQSFANVRNVLDYFLIGQYRLYVPNSWKLFLFTYFPNYWSLVQGKFYILSVFLFFSSVVYFVISLIFKKVSTSMSILGMIFIILLFINRFYKGERTEGYLLYFAPFILIISGWFIYKLISYKYKALRFAGLLILMTILILNFKAVLNIISYKSQLSEIKHVIAVLEERFPKKKFDLYDYEFKAAAFSLPANLILGFDNKTSENGIPLGFSCNGCPREYPEIAYLGGQIMDLTDNLNKELNDRQKGWARISNKNIYDNQVGWLNKNQLKSTFSLKNYIMERIGGL